MDIVVIGLGYVGIANVISLAKKGHRVMGFDANKSRVDAYIKGESPLSEPDVDTNIKKHRSKIAFTSEPGKAYAFSSIYLIAVDTPTKENGESDLTNFNSVIDSIIDKGDEEGAIIIRSTVPMGTSSSIREKLPKYKIISNPEFLAGGSAVRDELMPMRIVVGAKSEEELALMRNIYKKDISSGTPYYETTNISAELSKYASNSFLAAKISFINSLARYADEVGADIDIVASIMGSDPRIAPSMLKSGVGYGGSCFKKDSEALLFSAAKSGIELPIVRDSLKINEEQPAYLIRKMKMELGNLKGVNVTVLGLSYKGNCADLRSSKSIDLVGLLLKEEAIVTAYDPYKESRIGFGPMFPNVKISSNIREAVSGADCLLIANDNKSFKNMDEQSLLKLMKGRHIFDGRNLYPKKYFKFFKYISIGRPH